MWQGDNDILRHILESLFCRSGSCWASSTCDMGLARAGLESLAFPPRWVSRQCTPKSFVKLGLRDLMSWSGYVADWHPWHDSLALLCLCEKSCFASLPTCFTLWFVSFRVVQSPSMVFDYTSVYSVYLFWRQLWQLDLWLGSLSKPQNMTTLWPIPCTTLCCWFRQSHAHSSGWLLLSTCVCLCVGDWSLDQMEEGNRGFCFT